MRFSLWSMLIICSMAGFQSVYAQEQVTAICCSEIMVYKAPDASSGEQISKSEIALPTAVIGYDEANFRYSIQFQDRQVWINEDDVLTAVISSESRCQCPAGTVARKVTASAGVVGSQPGCECVPQ